MRQAKWIALVLLIAGAGSSRAEVPRQISYQGVLTGVNGVAAIDGQYQLRFRVLAAIDASAADAVYVETHDNVAVIRGVFQVIIGGITPMALPFDQPYFLELSVLAGPGVTTPLTFPRTQFTSVPYALRADTANSVAAGGAVRRLNGLSDDVQLTAGSNITITPNGNNLEIAATGGGGMGGAELPFPGAVETATAPLTVTQRGTGGGLAVTTDSPASNEVTANISTNSSGSALRVTSSYVGQAGQFEQSHASNPNPALEAINNAGGPALRALNYGTGWSGYLSGNGTNLGLYVYSRSTAQGGNLVLEQAGIDESRVQLSNASSAFWTIGGRGSLDNAQATMGFSLTNLNGNRSILTLRGDGRVDVAGTVAAEALSARGLVQAAQVTAPRIISSSLSADTISVTGRLTAAGLTTPSGPLQPALFDQVWTVSHNYGIKNLWVSCTYPQRTMDECRVTFVLPDSAVVMVATAFGYYGNSYGRWANAYIAMDYDNAASSDIRDQMHLCAPTQDINYPTYMYPASKTFVRVLGPGEHSVRPRLVFLDSSDNFPGSPCLPGGSEISQKGVCIEHAEVTVIAVRKWR
jgi:hypothetical protein